MRVIRSANLFLGLGLRRQMLLVEAIVALAGARLSLAVFSFSHVAKKLGSLSSRRRGTTPRFELESEELNALREIRWAIRVTSRRVPFRAVCLQQAVAAHGMLRRRGISTSLHLGVMSGREDAIRAHAWLEAGGVPVTGYPIAPEITEIGCFT